MTLGPIDPSMTGNSNDFPEALSVNVTVPAVPTWLLLPSIDAPLVSPGFGFDQGQLPDRPAE
jgi:hypothetical protein